MESIMKHHEARSRTPLARSGPGRADRGVARSFDSTELFAGATEIEIIHDQAVYRLKITRQGKLILNK